MRTERQIIYTMLDTLRAGEISNDERLTERYLRDLLRKYRPDIIRKYAMNGPRISPECFQEFDIYLDYVSTGVYETEIPAIIRLSHDEGFYVHINDTRIAVVTPMEYKTYTGLWSNRFRPVGKTEGQLLTIYIGDEDNPYVEAGSDLEQLIQDLKASISAFTVADQANLKGTLKLRLGAVLYNTDDDPNYDWDTDVYPFPSERITELTNTIMAREFGIVLQAKPDEIQNARPDSIRYHDQDDVSQN